MVAMAQSAANWRDTHTHVGSHVFTPIPTPTQLQPDHVVRSASSAISEFGIEFDLRVPEGTDNNNVWRLKKHPLEKEEETHDG